MSHKLALENVKSRMGELGLEFMSSNLDSYLSGEARQNRTLLESIHTLIDTEYIPRMERMAKTRLKVSGIPDKKLLSDYNLEWLKGGLTQKKFNELESLAFIEQKENLVLIGPSGVGKSHLMKGLAHKACVVGYTAYHITCMELVEVLTQAKLQNKLARKLKWFKKPNLLLIDEVGYQNLSKAQATLFFQLINSRYEKGSIIITSNKPFAGWAEIMDDEAIATATLDRLLHHSQVVILKGDSYRMKDKMKIGL
jgi:DNA replication protein DnaC